MLFRPDPVALTLRDYQVLAVEKLRDGRRAGHRRQILAMPTGSGKTETAIHLILEAMGKGSTVWFIVDRVTLVDQTSDRFGAYGIDHGILQGDHLLTDMSKSVQVISTQTLERRLARLHPNLIAKLIIVDEAHCQYKAVVELCARETNATVIGLTATPFTAGMANNWDGLVNATTVNKLLASGHLSPLRIKACVAPDFEGVKLNSKKEYEDEEAGQRGITIIGDVVQTWVEQTAKHFGGPAKTIVFAPSVAHGAELCRQFAAAGFNFQQLSHLDRDEGERRAKVAEFREPDSAIHGLVSCAVLTRGFDVSDVMVGISCKPYRKSFSAHIQEMGRVMRTHPGKTFGLWLDHSSNAVRFADDTAWLYEYGVDSLSDAQKRDSTVREPTEAVRRKHFCAECGTQMTSDVCPACGWQRPMRGDIQIVQGELIDLEISTKEAFQPRPGLRADCLKRPRALWNSAVAYCMANTRKGEVAARKWAYRIFLDIYPGAKLPRGLFDQPVRPDFVKPDEWSLIDREVRNFRKRNATRKAA